MLRMYPCTANIEGYSIDTFCYTCPRVSWQYFTDHSITNFSITYCYIDCYRTEAGFVEMNLLLNA
jgi:hypothetical protein